MPKFFVPNADNPKEAEEAYSSLRKHNYYGDVKPGRLYRIAFLENEKVMTAQVGHELRDFPEPAGEVVFAIIETTNVCTIHTAVHGVGSTRPIPVSPRKIRSREYFDDYPPGPSAEGETTNWAPLLLNCPSRRAVFSNIGGMGCDRMSDDEKARDGLFHDTAARPRKWL